MSAKPDNDLANIPMGNMLLNLPLTFDCFSVINVNSNKKPKLRKIVYLGIRLLAPSLKLFSRWPPFSIISVSVFVYRYQVK